MSPRHTILSLAYTIVLGILAVRVSGEPPEVRFSSGTETDVLITGRGPDKTVRVGLPTFELHQYLSGRGYDLSDSHAESFLVFDSAGRVEQDINSVSLAADTYFFSDALVNRYLSPFTVVDIDAVIAETESSIFNADIWLALTLWTEFLEVARNTVVKFIIAVKTGDAELTYTAAVEAGATANLKVP